MSTPSGLVAAATEKVEFDVSGKAGQALSFSSANDLDATVRAFDAMAALAGRHRYVSRAELIFVQLNSEAPEPAAAQIKAMVEGL